MSRSRRLPQRTYPKPNALIILILPVLVAVVVAVPYLFCSIVGAVLENDKEMFRFLNVSELDWSRAPGDGKVNVRWERYPPFPRQYICT